MAEWSMVRAAPASADRSSVDVFGLFVVLAHLSCKLCSLDPRLSFHAARLS